jgi:hypothetical protein
MTSLQYAMTEEEYGSKAKKEQVIISFRIKQQDDYDNEETIG